MIVHWNVTKTNKITFRRSHEAKNPNADRNMGRQE